MGNVSCLAVAHYERNNHQGLQMLLSTKSFEAIMGFTPHSQILSRKIVFLTYIHNKTVDTCFSASAIYEVIAFRVLRSSLLKGKERSPTEPQENHSDLSFN